ncbi:MAG: GMC family oxidoreductase [Paracoccaceae bacterium]
MLPLVTPQQAAGKHWDIIICGSSFSAMFFALGLAPHLSVLFVEKGGHQPHDDQIQGRIAGLEDFDHNNQSGQPKDWVAHSLLGGNSNCWWACTPRFHPSDFRMRSLYGIGQDWPVSYGELAPFYQQVENVMQVSGGGSDHILPRSAPFPFPDHIPSRTDMLLREKSHNWFAQPTARANGGDRANCCANGVCNRCPVDAKFTILNSISAFTRPNISLLLNSEMRSVNIQAGKATGVVVKTSTGAETQIDANTVALGANAIFNAAILLRSGVQHPNLGKGLNEQVSVRVDIAGPGLGYFGGTSITGHGYDLYDGAHRRDNSGILIETYNSPAIISTEFGKWGNIAQLKLIAEDLPQDQNQVRLTEDDNSSPVIDWHGHSDYALAGLKWGVSQLPELLPDGVEVTHISDLSTTEAHLMGTHPMGNDPSRHVVNGQLQVHGVAGLFALGSGAFPTTSPANPTLTLAALALRAAQAVAT